MSEFKRRLDRIERLKSLANSSDENWWKELLRFWRPSGTDAGTHGLRLAIRDNYLNFYRRGQSVARVAFDQNGDPYASVHLKYLGAKGKNAEGYARLKGGVFSCQGRNFSKDYELGKSFPEIIAKTLEWGGREKYFVDLAVAHNDSVIDLEIGLPRLIGAEGGAPRMDLALLERSGSDGQVKVVFWEAKTIDDGRLRALDPSNVEVHDQLQKYVTFMEDDREENNRRQGVTEAYRAYCRLLIELSEMVPQENPVTLSPLVKLAACTDSDLVVEKRPRLVIFEGKTENKGEICHVKRVSTWDKTHFPRLSNWLPKVFTDGHNYRLTE
jgi:hypothetical protein